MDTLNVANGLVVAGTPVSRTTPHVSRGNDAAGPEPAPRTEQPPEAVPGAPAPAPREFDPAALEAAMEDLKRQEPELSARGLEISYNDESSRFVVKILDKKSGEVVRQFPPEEILALHQRMEELRGVLFDEHS